MGSAHAAEVLIANAAIPLQRRTDEVGVEFEAELWCEFDCVAYVFVGTDRDELAARIQAARAGEHSWDYARPLSRDELYGDSSSGGCLQIAVRLAPGCATQVNVAPGRGQSRPRHFEGVERLNFEAAAGDEFVYPPVEIAASGNSLLNGIKAVLPGAHARAS